MIFAKCIFSMIMFFSLKLYSSDNGYGFYDISEDHEISSFMPLSDLDSALPVFSGSERLTECRSGRDSVLGGHSNAPCACSDGDSIGTYSVPVAISLLRPLVLGRSLKQTQVQRDISMVENNASQQGCSMLSTSVAVPLLTPSALDHLLNNNRQLIIPKKNKIAGSLKIKLFGMLPITPPSVVDILSPVGGNSNSSNLKRKKMARNVSFVSQGEQVYFDVSGEVTKQSNVKQSRNASEAFSFNGPTNFAVGTVRTKEKNKKQIGMKKIDRVK